MLVLIGIVIYTAIAFLTYFFVVKGRGLIQNPVNNENPRVEEILVSALWPYLYTLLGIDVLSGRIFRKKNDEA